VSRMQGTRNPRPCDIMRGEPYEQIDSLAKAALL